MPAGRSWAHSDGQNPRRERRCAESLGLGVVARGVVLFKEGAFELRPGPREEASLTKIWGG